MTCDYGHRVDGFIVHALRHLRDNLRRRGIDAVYPVDTPLFRSHRLGPTRPSCNWSERHVAYACGLGTFGLARGLITEGGIAHRCASLLVAAEFERYGTLADSHTANCPYLTEGTCGECMSRCPVDAISPQGHDVFKCRYVSVTHWGHSEAVYE